MKVRIIVRRGVIQNIYSDTMEADIEILDYDELNSGLTDEEEKVFAQREEIINREIKKLYEIY